MIRILLPVLFSFISINGLLAESNIAKNASQADSLKIIELNETGYELANTDLDSALIILEQAYVLSLASRNAYLIAHTEFNKGNTLAYKGKLDSASYYTLSAMRYFEAAQDSAKMFSAYRKVGQIYQQLNRFDEAWVYYQNARDLCQISGNPKDIGTSMNDIGSFYINKGWTYNDSLVQHFHTAEGYILQAVEYFKKAEYERGIALCYGNLSNIATDLEEPQKAIYYSKKGLGYFEKLKLNIYSVISYNQLAKIYVQLKKYDSSIYYAEKSLALANQLNSNIDRRNAAAWLSASYEGLNDFERALKYQKEYHNYQFHLLSEENNNAISELDKKYQTEKKIAENELLKKDNLLKANTIDAQKNLIITSVTVIFVLMIVAFFIYRANVIRKKLIDKVNRQKDKIEHDKQIIESQKTKLEELDKAKSRFFANISHDLRSPLTMMLGNIESVIEDKDSYLTQKSESNLISGFNNGKRIVQLSDEITDLSVLEDGNINLNFKHVKIVPFLRLLVQMFQSAAEQKKITLDFTSGQKEDYVIKMDPKQFEKIIYNLISNAIKFTETGGITVSVEEIEQENLKIDIRDTGTGIPENSLPFIFDRYYQSSDNKYNPKEGLGIGLSLVKELVDLHHGQVSVESVMGNGTCFSLTFPLETTVEKLTLPEISDYTKNKTSLDKALVVGAHKNSPIGELSFDNQNQKKHLILIVEDHPEIKKYINDIIAVNYQTILADNGIEALKIMEHKQIDLVITDLMMPWMDGFELIDTMKENKQLQKIPVMVLSARTGEEDRNNILNKGINNFLSKPFDKRELLTRIENLLTQKENWSGNNGISVSNDLKPEDEIEKGILEKVEKYIISRISDPSLSVADLGSELAASERQVYRMIKNIAHITPLELIKEVRYQYAHQLFTQKKIKNYSEAAKAIGLKNASHFKEEYLNRYENIPV